jgi:hypothetical protein
LQLRRDFTYRYIEILDVNILWHLQHSILETPKWTWINGLDSILIQWLRLNRDFRILVALFLLSLHVTICETPIWSWINGPDLILIQRLQLSHDFAYHEIGIPVDDIT